MLMCGAQQHTDDLRGPWSSATRQVLCTIAVQHKPHSRCKGFGLKAGRAPGTSKHTRTRIWAMLLAYKLH